MEPVKARMPLSQLKRGALEFCVLAVLAREESYGFDLVQRLSVVEGLIMSEGTIYPLLTRLRKEGWVETTWRESTAGPPRRYYSITDVGMKSLAQFETEWRKFRDSVEALLNPEGTSE